MPGGAALRHVAAAPQPWRLVRRWLIELTREIEDAIADGTLESLTLDRMWITRRGEAVLLDYGVGPPVASAFAATLEGGQQFLHHVARVGLMGWREAVPAAIERPLSFAAFDTLDRLAGAAFESFDAVRSALEALEHHPDEVSRRRRVASLLLPGLPVFFCSVAVTVILQQFLRHHRTCRWRGRYRRPAVRGADCGGRDHLDSERICEQGWRGSPVVGIGLATGIGTPASRARVLWPDAGRVVAGPGRRTHRRDGHYLRSPPSRRLLWHSC